MTARVHWDHLARVLAARYEWDCHGWLPLSEDRYPPALRRIEVEVRRPLRPRKRWTAVYPSARLVST